MIRSMSGFGSGTASVAEGTVTVEVRSINSRHLDVNLRVPGDRPEWEARVRELVAGTVERGRVDLYARAEPETGDQPKLELDEERIEGLLRGFEKLRDTYALPGRVDLPLLVAAGDVLRERRSRPLAWVDADLLGRAAEQALDEMVAMREAEGRRLETAMRGRLAELRERVERVEEAAPRRLERQRQRLREAVAELVSEIDAGDRDRIDREIALLADKWDIGEELTRTRSHLDAYEEYLDAPSPEPVGKRLKFLVQELHREINTTGAKANDAGISREVVEMKNELETLREQVANVE